MKPIEITNQEAIELIKKKDNDAFNAFVSKYKSVIFKPVNDCLKEYSETIDDVENEVLAAVSVAIKNFNMEYLQYS